MSLADRLELRELGEGFYAVVGRYGFMEVPTCRRCCPNGRIGAAGLAGRSLTETTFYLGRETLIATPRSRPKRLPGDPRRCPLARRLFIVMTRNARSATAFFGLPPNRVVELGAQIQI